jgi:hypothetical protein
MCRIVNPLDHVGGCISQGKYIAAASGRMICIRRSLGYRIPSGKDCGQKAGEEKEFLKRKAE